MDELNEKKKYIAIDIGGTQLRAALYPEHGIEPITKKISATHAGSEKPEDRLIDVIGEIWPESGGVECIGIAVPGRLIQKPVMCIKLQTSKAGSICHLVSLLKNATKQRPFWEMMPIWRLWRVEIWCWCGHHDLIYLTISTGIGGGFIIDDRLLVGPQGIAGEVGHITVFTGRPPLRMRTSRPS